MYDLNNYKVRYLYSAKCFWWFLKTTEALSSACISNFVIIYIWIYFLFFLTQILKKNRNKDYNLIDDLNENIPIPA